MSDGVTTFERSRPDLPPRESFALFNPAFVASVVAAGANHYEKKSRQPLPYAYAFLITPLVLVEQIRRSLPTSTRRKLGAWASSESEARMRFPSAAARLVEPTRHGVRYGLTTGGLELEGSGLRGRVRRSKKLELTDEVNECLSKAEFTGRWLAVSGPSAAVFLALGVRP